VQLPRGIKPPRNYAGLNDRYFKLVICFSPIIGSPTLLEIERFLRKERERERERGGSPPRECECKVENPSASLDTTVDKPAGDGNHLLLLVCYLSLSLPLSLSLSLSLSLFFLTLFASLELVFLSACSLAPVKCETRRAWLSASRRYPLP